MQLCSLLHFWPCEVSVGGERARFEPARAVPSCGRPSAPTRATGVLPPRARRGPRQLHRGRSADARPNRRPRLRIRADRAQRMPAALRPAVRAVAPPVTAQLPGSGPRFVIGRRAVRARPRPSLDHPTSTLKRRCHLRAMRTGAGSPDRRRRRPHRDPPGPRAAPCTDVAPPSSRIFIRSPPRGRSVENPLRSESATALRRPWAATDRAKSRR